VPDVEGPKVTLGLVWLAAALAAAAWSQPLLAVLMALASAAAADEVARIHLGARRWTVALAGAVLPVAALLGSTGLVAGAAAVCALPAAGRLLHRGGPAGTVEGLAVGLVGPLVLGLAAASPVLLARLGPAAAVTMVVLVSAYEAGDFTFGAGASVPWEGPAAGIVAVAVFGFGAWVLDVAPLDQVGVVWLAATVGVLAPLGPPVGSVLLGAATRPGRYVRRLDTLLVAGPLAAWAVAQVVHPV
jgi:hypothetical protein